MRLPGDACTAVPEFLKHLRHLAQATSSNKETKSSLWYNFEMSLKTHIKLHSY